MIKRKLFLALCGLVMGSVFLNAQTLNEVILTAAVRISSELPSNTTAAIINFRSDSEELNIYVIDELYGAILRNRRVIPVKPNQEQFQSIRGETDFNTTGKISEEAARSIGRLLRAQYLLTGSLENIGYEYIIHFNVIDTEKAEPKSQYSASLNRQNDTQFAQLLGDNLANSPSPDTGSQQETARNGRRAQSETSVSASQAKNAESNHQAAEESSVGDIVALKFSLGLVFGITYFKGTHNEYDHPYSAAYLSIFTPTWDLRLLFSLENKLRLGCGVDWAFSFVMTRIMDGGGRLDVSGLAISGTAASYAIIGYSNAYLHIGYDFSLGGLYAAPCFIINKHLMIGLPMTLFGSNQHFSILNTVVPPDKEEINYFNIGLSFQYVFGKR